MDEVITCNCGSQAWVIGESIIRCDKCDKHIFVTVHGSSVEAVRETNKWLETFKETNE